MAQTNFKYTIIVPTYNRLDELQELIRSIEQFDFPKERFELLVTDDGSQDGTAAYFREKQFSFPLRYIRQENAGPSEARNFGMRNAHGDYFLFTDSDCILPPDYLWKIDQHLADNPLDAFGGPDDSHPDFPPFLKAVNFALTSFLGTGGTRGGSDNAVTKFYPRSFNLGIHRKVFETIGGMQLRWGEDIDFAIRIYQAGFKVGLIKEAFVYHKRRTNLKQFYRQVFNWGKARINLSKMYPDTLKLIHLAPAIIVAGVVLVSLLALFFSWGLWLFDFMLAGMLLVAIVAFVQSFTQNRSLKVAFLSIITLFTQVFAYGIGSWSGILRVIQGKPAYY